MATYTENYNLEKPAQSDLYNIDVFNENADKIDEALGDKAENQSLAPIESSATASRNYSVGQQFVYNGLLYEATSAIASGGTITPGSNCARTTVAEELSALNDSLTNLSETGFVASGDATKNNNILFNGNTIIKGPDKRYIIFAILFAGASSIFSVSNYSGTVKNLAESDQGSISCFYSTTTNALCIKASTTTSIAYKVIELA